MVNSSQCVQISQLPDLLFVPILSRETGLLFYVICEKHYLGNTSVLNEDFIKISFFPILPTFANLINLWICQYSDVNSPDT